MARRGARDAPQGLGRGAGRERHDCRRHAIPRQDPRRLADDLVQRPHGPRSTSIYRPTIGCVPACTRAAKSRSARGLPTWCRWRASSAPTATATCSCLSEDNIVARRRVETGAMHDESIEIVSGVESRRANRRQGRRLLEGRRPRQRQQRGERLMNFVTWSIRNPVPVIVLFIALTVAGLISFPKLGVLDRPDIEFPAVVVTVTYPGVAPTQMESRDHAQGRGCRRDDRRHRADDLDRRRGRVDDEHRVPFRHGPLAPRSTTFATR